MALRKAFVSGGHVYCQPRREDRDVAMCFGCRRLREVNDRSSPPFIQCDVTDMPQADANDPRFVEWWYAHHRRGPSAHG